MLFENTFLDDNFYLLLITYILGVLFLLLFFFKKKNECNNPHSVKYGKVIKAALVGGFGISFMLTILISTLTPSVITINEDLSHSGTYSFYGNEGFLGIGGSFIKNNSDIRLQVIGIENDKDINVVIEPNTTKSVRKLPEEYFHRTPTNETRADHYTRTTAKGRRRVVQGNTVFIFQYGLN